MYWTLGGTATQRKIQPRGEEEDRAEIDICQGWRRCQWRLLSLAQLAKST